MDGQKITVREDKAGEELSIVMAGKLEGHLILADNNPVNLRLVSKERGRFGESSFTHWEVCSLLK